MRLRSSCYVQVLLLAVAAIHSNVSAEDSEVVSLDEALGTYAGPDGYAHVSHVPVGVGVLKVFKGSKHACQKACHKDPNCKGFKWSLHSDHLAPTSGACSLMGSNGSSVGSLVPGTQAPVSSPTSTKSSKPRGPKPSKREVAKALKLLGKEVPTESKGVLEHIMNKAKRNLKKPLSAAHRNIKRFEKRSLGMIKRISVLEATLRQLKKFRNQKIAFVKKRIKKKLSDLPASSAPGSQMQVQRRLVREARNRLRRKIQRRDRSARRKARSRKAKRKLKSMVGRFGPKVTHRVLRKQLTKLRNSIAKNRIRLSARDFGRPSLTASKYADNMAKCPRLKRLCASSSKVRRQCPSTCKSVLVAMKKADAKKLAKAGKIIATKTKAKATAAAKKLRAIKRHNSEVQGKTAAVKEAQNKLRAKAKKLQVKKDNRKIVYKVKYDAGLSAQKKNQQKADRQSYKAQEKGIAMAIVAGKTADKAAKLLQKAKKTIKTQKKLTKQSKAKVSVAVVKKGKVTLQKPHPVKDVSKASKLSSRIKSKVIKGMSKMDQGVEQLKKARDVLKKAIGRAKAPHKPGAKPFATKAKKNTEHIKKAQNSVKKAEAALKKAKQPMKAAKKGQASKGAKSKKSKASKKAKPVKSKASKKAKPKKSKASKKAKPVKSKASKKAKPKKAKAVKPKATVVELGEELGESDDAMDAADMYAGIVCRIRTALKLGQTRHPKLLAKFEHSAIFLQKKAKLKPLWGCLHDGTKSDSQCGTLVSQSVYDLMDMLPEVQSLKKSIGPEYHKAVGKGCKKA